MAKYDSDKVRGLNDRKSSSPLHRHRHKRGGRSGYLLMCKVSLVAIISTSWSLWLLNYQPTNIYDQYLDEPPTKRDTKSIAVLTETLPSELVSSYNGSKSRSDDEAEELIDADALHKDSGVKPVTVVKSISSGEEQFLNHKYMFVHIGKAGGTTLQNNIRIICIRKSIEQNLMGQRRKAKNSKKDKGRMRRNKVQNEPRIRTMPCYKKLNNQSDPSVHDPPTEMALSTDGRVIGFMHMNKLEYWWNANDDGEAFVQTKNRTIQNEIDGILASNPENPWNITAILNPPPYLERDDGMTKSTAFLTPVRDPIDRLVSAYNYHYPGNRKKVECAKFKARIAHNWNYYTQHAFYCECFPSINDLVSVLKEGGGPPKYIQEFSKWSDGKPFKQVSCRNIAESALRGRSHYKHLEGNENEKGLEEDLKFDQDIIGVNQKDHFTMGHITMNYAYYYRRTFRKYPEKDIVVIRTDHLWEDLQNLEYKLGGTASIQGESTGHDSQTHGSGKYSTSEKVTDPKDLQALCCAISSEARIYIELIERAINLSDEEKKESLQAFEKRCNLTLCK